ncbi:MAG: tRNA1(Val) (adenine(37)-N6)-methyltransferase [Nitrospirota bacterium]
MEVTLDSIRDIRLYQAKTGYRFSVDSLLLYDFVNLQKLNSIADIGAGSGIVGILLAKKYPEADVLLVEIQENLANIAEKNIILNGLEDRVKVVKADITKIGSQGSGSSPFTLNYFDLVVSNPPFRKSTSGRISMEAEKAIARHEIKLNLSELINAVSYLLRIKGRFCMIYHPHRLSDLMMILKRKELEPKRLRFVHSKKSSEAKMVLLEAVKKGKTGIKVDNPFFIYKDDGSYTDGMKEIYNADS